jgi:hypothetical protein
MEEFDARVYCNVQQDVQENGINAHARLQIQVMQPVRTVRVPTVTGATAATAVLFIHHWQNMSCSRD